MVRKLLLGAAAALLMPLSALAEDVGPFGLSIGTTTVDKAREILSAETRIEDAGINKWTDGPMIEADGDGLGLDRLDRALLIFDADERLTGVILTLPKSRYDDLKAMLGSQYQLVSATEPFVGTREATFQGDENGEVKIELFAPHLGFDMEVRYLHVSLLQAFNRGSKEEAEKKEKAEKALL